MFYSPGLPCKATPTSSLWDTSPDQPVDSGTRNTPDLGSPFQVSRINTNKYYSSRFVWLLSTSFIWANSLGGGAPNNLQSLTFPDRWQSSIVPAPTEKLWAKLYLFSRSVSMQSRLQGIQQLLFPPATFHSKTNARNFPSFFRYTHGYVFSL